LTPALLFLNRFRNNKFGKAYFGHYPGAVKEYLDSLSWSNIVQEVKDPINREAFFINPTLFWFIPPTAQNLGHFALLGAALSALILMTGRANLPIAFTLWLLYFSIVGVGQTWYSFGWESQVLESGFLLFFMVPIFSLDKMPSLTPLPWVARWGYRWLLFRIMLGAGMIKIRGDQCWRDLTCMNYHYQTQPVPNPISVYFHNNPGIQ
jgi:hypothetical protein